MSGVCDVIIVGGGHNGLVCANYLARAGRRVLLLEKSPQVGGCAVTDEFAPGFRVSSGAHILNMLHPRVLRDLDLARHGLSYAATNMATIALDRDARHLIMDAALNVADTSPAILSPSDTASLAQLRARLLRFAGFVHAFQAKTPPRLATKSLSDKLALAQIGWKMRRLGRADMREFLRVALINVADVLNDELDNDLLKGAIGFDAILGTELGPRSPNSLFSLLYRLSGKMDGTAGSLAQPKGGMGAVTAAMATSARAAGVEIRTDAAVARIIVKDDRAAGVALASGETIRAATVISNADPKTTFLSLLGPEYLDTGFVRRIANIRTRGTVAKLHLALNGLPKFTGLDATQLSARLLIAPDLDYVERAFNHCKYGEYSAAPALEIIFPTVSDPGLAPKGQHVMSAIVQYAPYALKGGWDAGKDAFADIIVDTIAQYAPGLKPLIKARELLSPADIEARFGTTGGHWHHAELAPDQLLMMRPVPGAGQYETPMPGLWLCGAGSHPGGGVIGAAGMNAARRLIKQGGK